MENSSPSVTKLIPMKVTIRLTFLLVVLIANTPHVLAEVRLAGIFADHTMLQRDRPVQIWGWADKGEEVNVEFAEQAATVTADEDGTWSVMLKPLAASTEVDVAVDVQARHDP